MASAEFLKKRVAGKQRELDELHSKLDRIQKAESSNWVNNPYGYSDRDLHQCLKSIQAAESSLLNYTSQLIAERSVVRDISAILEFLDAWKSRVIEYYSQDLAAFFDDLEAVRNLAHVQSCAAWGSSEYLSAAQAYSDAREAFNQKRRGYFEVSHGRRIKVRSGEYEHLEPYIRSTYAESLARLKAEVDGEAIRKYDDIVRRTSEIVGTITDASDLSIGLGGDLNGVIQGTAGSATVRTIGAGGYNIQCYHFRCLVRAKS